MLPTYGAAGGGEPGANGSNSNNSNIISSVSESKGPQTVTINVSTGAANGAVGLVPTSLRSPALSPLRADSDRDHDRDRDRSDDKYNKKSSGLFVSIWCHLVRNAITTVATTVRRYRIGLVFALLVVICCYATVTSLSGQNAHPDTTVDELSAFRVTPVPIDGDDGNGGQQHILQSQQQQQQPLQPLLPQRQQQQPAFSSKDSSSKFFGPLIQLFGDAQKQPPPPSPSPQQQLLATLPPPNDGADLSKQDAVRDAMRFAWNSYKGVCWGQDELLPTSRSCDNPFGMGLTIVDSLDTLWIMGLTEEFNSGRDWVASSLRFDIGHDVSFFETTIRVFAGLEAAYDLSGDQMFLDKARDVGSRLAFSFDTPTGLPQGSINLATHRSQNPGWTGGASVLAEVGTVQLENFYLSHKTGDNSFRDKAQRVLDLLDRAAKPVPGLYPLFINPQSGQFTTSKISFGAMGDSFYEYLLKAWLLTGKKNEQLQRMYQEAIRGLKARLIQKTTNSNLLYIADLEGGLVHKMDHLACFAAGMLALGANQGIVTGAEADDHLSVATQLAETCYQMYDRQGSKISPEFVNFFGGDMSVQNQADYYLLRPETVESMFILWRITHDQRYRDYGWSIFSAIERHARGPNGYSSLRGVSGSSPSQYGKQESFYLAETLKYLYLLFSDDQLISLDRYVFNTEAHPLSRWT